MKRILFVCTGNTCRSPLAEGLLRRMAEQNGWDLEVQSAGVSAMNGGPISNNSMQILIQSGFKGSITSSDLDPKKIQWADLILTMTGSHKRHVIQRFPDAIDKTYTLKEFADDGNDQERDEFFSELQLKQALGKGINGEERLRIMQYNARTPDYDISDPYGGPMAVYQQTASEIKQQLNKLAAKLGLTK